METFEFVSAVRGYHIYKDIWEPSVGEKLIAHREFGNQFDKFAIKVLNGEQTVGHLPREYSRIAWYFLARGGSITLEVTGLRRHCKQLCGGMEIPCCVRFSCSRKATINRLNNFKYYRVHDARHQPNDCYHHSINPFLDETILKGRIVACTCSK